MFNTLGGCFFFVAILRPKQSSIIFRPRIKLGTGQVSTFFKGCESSLTTAFVVEWVADIARAGLGLRAMSKIV